jgi:hypothetical protein
MALALAFPDRAGKGEEMEVDVDVGAARGLLRGVGTEGGWSAVGVREVPEGLMGLTHWGAKWMDI